MESLSTKIKLYLGRDFSLDEVLLQDDMVDGVSNPYIKEWNISSEKAKPTDDQLNALESEATKLENNSKVDATRRTSYGSWNEQLDEIYHNIDDWKARIKAVKDSNPKESS